jgi:tetratricopeptide (TPR) repeat protein
MRKYGSLFLPLMMVVLVQCKSKKNAGVAQPPKRIPLSYAEQYYSAELVYQSGDYKAADSMFRICASKPFLPSPAYYRLACIEQSKGHLSEAMALTAKAVAADTANHHYHLYAAELYKQGGSYEKAGDIYFQQAAKSVRGWTLYMDAVKCYQNAGKWEKVLAVCNHAETKFGLLEALGENRSNAYNALGNYNAAAMEWDRLVKKYPDRRSYRMRLAGLLSLAGNSARASAIYDSLYNENPNDGALLATMCQFRLKKDQFNQLELLRKLASSNTATFAQKWNCIIVALTFYELYDSMEMVLTALTQLHPSSKQAADALADWCSFHGQHSRAAKLYKMSLWMSNADFSIWEKYLNVLSFTCSLNTMLGQADTLAELYPLDGRAHAYKALSLFLLNRNEEAMQNLQTASGFASGSEVQAFITAIKIRLLLSEDKTGEAEKEIQNLEKSSPDYPGLRMCKSEWLNKTGKSYMAWAPLMGYNISENRNRYETMWYCLLSLRLKLNPDPTAKKPLELFFPESPYWLDAVADYLQPSGECEQAVVLWKKAANCADYPFKSEIRNKINRCEMR